MTLPTDYPEKWYDNAIQMYAALVRTRAPFAQANYGDGEWATILGEQITNSQGETTTPELTAAMQQTLLEPAPGMWYGANAGKKRVGAAQDWLAKHNVDVPWIWKETLAAANVNGRLAPVFQALRARTVILVGPKHLRALPERVLVPDAFIEVPDAVAWQQSDILTRMTKNALYAYQGAQPLTLFCAGHASNLMMWRLLVDGTRHYGMLDFGACLDPYVGHLSRKGYQKPEWPERMEANLA